MAPVRGMQEFRDVETKNFRTVAAVVTGDAETAGAAARHGEGRGDRDDRG
jgi:hypothetical protein